MQYVIYTYMKHLGVRVKEPRSLESKRVRINFLPKIKVRNVFPRCMFLPTGSGCVSVRGVHPSQRALEGQLRRSTARRHPPMRSECALASFFLGSQQKLQHRLAETQYIIEVFKFYIKYLVFN